MMAEPVPKSRFLGFLFTLLLLLLPFGVGGVEDEEKSILAEWRQTLLYGIDDEINLKFFAFCLYLVVGRGVIDLCYFLTEE